MILMLRSCRHPCASVWVTVYVPAPSVTEADIAPVLHMRFCEMEAIAPVVAPVHTTLSVTDTVSGAA